MLSHINLTATLQSIPWFRELNESQLEHLAGITEIRKLDRDEVLFFEGEQIDYLYFVLEGKISIENFVPGREKVQMFVAEPLDIIGWASLTPVIRQREDTAIALLPSTLLGFKGENLRDLCNQDHDLGYFIVRRIANVVASRLLSTRLQLLDIIADLQDQNKEQTNTGVSLPNS
jgi:CRP/FNR family transcriptional regulator, cyclic AMP receptor protein